MRRALAAVWAVILILALAVAPAAASPAEVASPAQDEASAHPVVFLGFAVALHLRRPRSRNPDELEPVAAHRRERRWLAHPTLRTAHQLVLRTGGRR